MNNFLNIFRSNNKGRKFIIMCKDVVLCVPEDAYDSVNHVFRIRISPFKDFIIQEDEIEKFTIIGR